MAGALAAPGPIAVPVPSIASARAARAVPAPKPKAKPRRVNAARPAPSKRRGSRRQTARARRPLADRLPVRGAWVGGLALAFASPTAFLAAMPLGFEQKVTMAVATVLFVCLAGLAVTLRWLRGGKPRLAAAWLWLTAATAATLGLVGAGRWTWMVYTTGLGCLALGLAAFAWMERGRPDAFRPTGVGLVHGAVGLPVAYLPVLAIWAWTL
jgi:hypothetical protein